MTDRHYNCFFLQSLIQLSQDGPYFEGSQVSVPNIYVFLSNLNYVQTNVADSGEMPRSLIPTVKSLQLVKYFIYCRLLNFSILHEDGPLFMRRGCKLSFPENIVYHTLKSKQYIP